VKTVLLLRVSLSMLFVNKECVIRSIAEVAGSETHPRHVRLLDDFQRRNLVPFELEKVSKVNGAAGKISNQVAGDDYLPVLLFARERLTGVLILCRGVRLPRFDCGPAFVVVPLVLHDGIFSEASRNGLAITAVCGEVGGDGFWKTEVILLLVSYSCPFWLVHLFCSLKLWECFRHQ
jgi:hypothetical protein